MTKSRDVASSTPDEVFEALANAAPVMNPPSKKNGATAGAGATVVSMPLGERSSVELLDTAAPFDMAKRYRVSRAAGEDADLHHWQGDFWIHRGQHYEAWPYDALKADMYRWLEARCNAETEQPIKPNKALIERVADGLRAAAHLDVPTAPAWAVDAPASVASFEPRDLIACGNGLLHVPSRQLLPATRRFFTLNALSFDYDAEAPRPMRWLAFLCDLWGDDTESIETLQEMFGLALTVDTTHQKAFLIVGPRRAGKGVLARVLVELVGRGNITAPMLSSLGQQFGLESMIGKTLALISDARLGGRADIAAIVENILRITGEDAVSVPRKFKTDWTAPLMARFVILSNELPLLLDQSGALAGRFILLRLTRSFFGGEDPALTSKLLEELPGILLWALAGLDRLRQRGYFRQPKSALGMVRQLEMLASPIKAFVEERCFITSGASIECKVLYEEWRKWSTEQGREHAGSIQVFGRNFSAAFPTVKRVQPRDGASRERHYEGLRLRTVFDPAPEGDDEGDQPS